MNNNQTTHVQNIAIEYVSQLFGILQNLTFYRDHSKSAKVFVIINCEVAITSYKFDIMRF